MDLLSNILVLSFLVSGALCIYQDPAKNASTIIKFAEDCLAQNSMTKEDLPKNFSVAAMQNFSDQMYCFLKCFHEKTEYTKDGYFDIEKLREIPHVKDIEKDRWDVIVQCIKDHEPIKECTDLKAMNQCYVDKLTKKEK